MSGLAIWVIFPLVAAAAVWLAGRRDVACDPRLTTVALVAVLVFPCVVQWAPKVWELPGGALAAVGGVAPTWFGSLGRLLVGAWLLGAGMAVARILFALSGLRRWRADSRLLGMYRGVEVRELAQLGGPVAAGMWRRMIFVPAAWHGWSESARTMVLLHEHAHHQRRDPLWRLIGEVVVALHWYHPLVRWMQKRWIAQCEYACDARVLSNGVAASTYAGLLCDLASGSGRQLGLAMASAEGLEGRVRRLMGTPPQRRRATVVLGVLGFLGVALMLALCGEPARPRDLESDLRWSADPFPGN
jgi:beta-lactamase regulating signal transducer with metallopeptidase domain